MGPSRLQATAATWLDLFHGAGAARRLAGALAAASAAVRLGSGGTLTVAAAGARRAPAAGAAGRGSLAQFRDRRKVLQRLRDEARGEGLNPAAAAAAAAARHAGRHDSRRGPDAPTSSGAPPTTTTATTTTTITAAAAAGGDGGGTAVVVRLAVVDVCLHLGHATATAHALLRKGNARRRVPGTPRGGPDSRRPNHTADEEEEEWVDGGPPPPRLEVCVRGGAVSAGAGATAVRWAECTARVGGYEGRPWLLCRDFVYHTQRPLPATATATAPGPRRNVKPPPPGPSLGCRRTEVAVGALEVALSPLAGTGLLIEALLEQSNAFRAATTAPPHPADPTDTTTTTPPPAAGAAPFVCTSSVGLVRVVLDAADPFSRAYTPAFAVVEARGWAATVDASPGADAARAAVAALDFGTPPAAATATATAAGTASSAAAGKKDRAAGCGETPPVLIPPLPDAPAGGTPRHVHVQGGDVRAALQRLTVRFAPDAEPYLDARGWAIAGPAYVAALWHPSLAAAAAGTTVPLPSLRASHGRHGVGNEEEDEEEEEDGEEDQGGGSVLLARVVRGAAGPPKVYWDVDVAVAALALRVGPRTPLHLQVPAEPYLGHYLGLYLSLSSH